MLRDQIVLFTIFKFETKKKSASMFFQCRETIIIRGFVVFGIKFT